MSAGFSWQRQQGGSKPCAEMRGILNSLSRNHFQCETEILKMPLAESHSLWKDDASSLSGMPVKESHGDE